ncbi:class I adenylate-forming enzyme family protein [Balneola sp. MJW-20]|uniref:class I adenylate-forming enzyme family protein n=1 Tax=Gracilimonas aurantiaca TaxID=3234185 RepID=UPI00346625F3
MDDLDLEQKIEHARSVTDRLPPLEVNFVQLIKKGIGQDKTYLIYIDSDDRRTEISYRNFYDYVLNTAKYYQFKGLRKGDKIATISHNHWHTVVQYFAAWFCGLVVVPINLGEDDQRIAYILQNAEVKLALVREDYSDRIQSIADNTAGIKDLKITVCTEDSSVFMKAGGNLYEADIQEETDALIVFTSGTTGNPKGVVLTQGNLLQDARAIQQWHYMDSGTRMMCVLPIHHVNGTVVTMITPFFMNGSTVLNQKFSPGKFFEIISEEKVHIVSVVPTLLQYLSSYYEDKKIPEFNSLRHIICGAGPLTVKVARTFEERFHVPIIHGYGLSETTCYSCFIPAEQDPDEHRMWMRDFGYPSIGIPVPANEMDIQDPDGNTLNEEERGEIVIRGLNVMKGYFNNRVANEKAFAHGWFRSGDEGFYKLDDEGNRYFFITGRLKELIIRGGVNLAPLEIDEVINKAPGVKAGIAVGFENDWYGEEVGAFVQLKDGAVENPEAIINYCREHLPFSKCPKTVVFGDQIPVTSTGKYQRIKVAHLFDEWKEVQFREEM